MSELFSGIPVKNFSSALCWYEQLFGASPDFLPHETEAVWKLADRQYAYIVQKPSHAGHSVLMQMVDALDSRISEISERGIEYTEQEYFPNDICKVTYRDPDGNRISFGGVLTKSEGDA